MPSEAIFPWTEQNQKKYKILRIFLSGPMGPVQPVWALAAVHLVWALAAITWDASLKAKKKLLLLSMLGDNCINTLSKHLASDAGRNALARASPNLFPHPGWIAARATKSRFFFCHFEFLWVILC